MSRGPAEAVWHRNWAVNRLMWRTMARCGALARGRLLDLGCGDQPYRDLFAGRVTRYVGMERGRGRYLGSGVAVWGDALHLPFPDGSFDTVLSNQLLEHVREPARLLQEIGRILTPEGHLILTAPHIWGLHEQPDDYFRFTPYGTWLKRQGWKYWKSRRLRVSGSRPGCVFVTTWPGGSVGCCAGPCGYRSPLSNWRRWPWTGSTGWRRTPGTTF